MSQESGPGITENIDSTVELIGSPETSDNFPGAKILMVKEGDTFKRYALSRDGEGNLQGVEFEKQEYKLVSGAGGNGFWDSSDVLVDAEGELEVNGQVQQKFRIGPTNQLHADTLAELESTLSARGIQI